MAQKQGHTDFTHLNRVSADLHKAVRAAERARRALAHITGPDAPRVIVAPDLRWVQRALEAWTSRLKRIRGVVGFGLGRVIKDGKETREPCITVFVGRKRSRKALRMAKSRPLPRSLKWAGRRIRIDVVEVGRVRLHAFVGASLGPTDDPAESEGTIGAFAIDSDNGRTVAVTAMHVSGMHEFPNGSAPVEFSIPSIQLHDPHTKRLGVMTFGTRSGVDAAKVELDDALDADAEIPIIGKVMGWRPTTVPGDENLAVRMYGAQSKLVSGRLVHPSVELPALNLDSALIAEIATRDGDSGAALVDPQNHVLGFLVGQATSQYAGKAVFCSAVGVVNLLRVGF